MAKGDHDSPSGRGARCSFIHSHRFNIVAGIGALLSLVTVVLVCLQATGDLGSRNNSEPPFLLVADLGTENETGAILQVDITSGSKVTLPLEVVMPTALDYDPLTDYVYWSGRNNYIQRARRDGSGMETIIDAKGYHRSYTPVYGLALDHAGGNIYWSVYMTETISVAKKDGSSARTLLSSPAANMPYDLVLDPRNALMYWVDFAEARIERAAMDGSNQTTIITNLTYPRAIAIDFNEDRLYYSDYGYEIYSSDLLGNDIRQVMQDGEKWVNGIAVDEDFVYWSSVWPHSPSSPHLGKIGKLSKCDLTKTVLVDGLWTPDGIYLSTAAPPGVTNGRP
ncbi:low-density lipoprotein receptor-related protein 6-like [Branchiostoma floridae]|uniref:Low-density lipoprotein receptor-related protein 6-like n=1 Tax=Branchiostoma floridae TaxID=7739 RepID=A0A9J7LPR2_BRAFL|nr:low-density lipoprotein receptor-related protein 6-like [Branchiostoma floridae]